MIFRDYGPPIAKLLDTRLAGIDHRFYRECHTWLKFQAGSGLAVMQDLWFFMKFLADAMAAKLSHYAISHRLDETLDCISDIAKIGPGFDGSDAVPQCLIRCLAQTPGLNGRFADIEHSTAVTVIAVLDDSDVEIDDITIPENLVAGYPVADLVID